MTATMHLIHAVLDALTRALDRIIGRHFPEPVYRLPTPDELAQAAFDRRNPPTFRF